MIAYGISVGMQYLHSHNIIHRDLKLANILEDNDLYPKIADFGLSKIYNQNLTSNPAASFEGTPIYIAPEIWSDFQYSTKSDVYAYSIILYEIITGEVPFENENFFYKIGVDVSINNLRPSFHFPIPDHYKKLIESCWSKNPNERPSFNEIVSLLKSDEFFQSESEKSKFFNFIDGKDFNFEQFDSDQFDFIKKIGTDYNTCDYFKVRDKSTNKKLIAKKLHKRDHSNNAEIISKLEKIAQFNSNFIIHYKGYIEDESLQPIIVYDYYKNKIQCTSNMYVSSYCYVSNSMTFL